MPSLGLGAGPAGLGAGPAGLGGWKTLGLTPSCRVTCHEAVAFSGLVLSQLK